MNCVAKRVPATGAPGFFPQTPFELRPGQPSTSRAYLYSIKSLAANDQTDSDEEQRNGAPPVEQRERSPSGPALSYERKSNTELSLSEKSANQSLGSPQQRLDSTPSKCPVSSRVEELGQPSNLNPKCDRSLVRSKQNEQRRCNSLESVASRESSSSAGANEHEPDSLAQAEREPQSKARPASVSSASCRSAAFCRSRSVLVATRYVSPPKIDHDQMISATNWHTIPLRDEQHKPADGSQKVVLKEGPLVRGSSRLNSLISSCKMLSSRSSQDAGNKSKKLSSANDEQQPRAEQAPHEKESRKMSQLGEWATANGKSGQTRDGSLSDGPAGGRKSEGGGFARERIGSATSFKSVGSFQRSKAQIGKVEAPFMFAGILGSLLGSLFFSIGMLCIKLLPDGHGVADKTKILFCRGCIMVVLCGATIIYQKSTFKVTRDELWVNALRSVFGFFGVYGAYIALKYISLGDSTALVFSSPVWTSLLSHFILNEPLQWIQLLALPASLVGIILIAHPALLVNMEQHASSIERQPVLDVVDVLDVAELVPLNNSTANMVAQLNQTLNRDLDISMSTSEQFDFEHRWKGIVISLATSFIVSFVYILLKFRKTTPIQTTTFWLGVTTAVFSLIVMCFTGFGQPLSGLRDWSLLFAVGICSWLGQSLLQWAFAYEDASVLSVIRTLDVAMNFLLSALFLDEQIMWTSILGASIIAGVVASIMLNSWISKKLCPKKVLVEPNEQLESSYEDVDELAASETRRTSAARKETPLEEKRPVEGEITFKLEAPSLRKLREGELAA